MRLLAGGPTISEGWYRHEVATTLFFRSAELLLFLITVGVLLDRETLRRAGLHWRHLLDLYRLRTTRVALTYLAPAAVALATIATQILSGEFGGALSELVKSLPNAIPKG